MYKIKFTKQAKKFLKKYKWEPIYFKIFQSSEILKINPYKNMLDTKPLKGFENTYRIRLGKYRLIYEVFDDKIEIHFLEIDSRWGIYK